MPGSGITIAYGDKGPLVLGVSLPQAIAAIILVSLRAYAARTHNGKTRWDFIFVTFGLIFGFAAQIALLIATLHGLGNQIADVSFDDLWNILYLTWIGLVIGVVGITFAKLAVVALWLHLTPPTQPKRRAVLWGLGALIVLTNTVQIPLTLTQCTPFLHLWDRLTPGSCPRQVLAVKFSYFQGAVAILSDIFLALYPINVVYNLKMSVRTKVVFCLLMAGGLM
ncbi:hypothetical protein ANO11243_082200 [Dothideomycetidae sp. 11243]|nr:hypothetical protein ANO11243_082200 [fungal sp. No.11243]